MRNVKCSKCGHIGPESEFPTGRDFFQKPFIAACPKDCGNRQNPGDASMRMFGGERPFTFVGQQEIEVKTRDDAIAKVLTQAESAA